MKRILLIGGYGYRDVGDEAQLTASLLVLKHYIDDADFLVLSDDPEQTQHYHKTKTDYSIRECFYSNPSGEKSKTKNISAKSSRKVAINHPLNIVIQWLFAIKQLTIAFLLLFNAKRIQGGKRPFFLNDRMKSFLLNLKQSDLLFNVGGGNITSVWRSEFHMKSLTFLICRIFRKPIVLSGQTIGPFFGRVDRWIARYSLSMVNLITLRESYSKVNMDNIHLGKTVALVTADDSIQLPPASLQRVQEILVNSNIPSKKPLIAMNIFGLSLQKTESNLARAKLLLAKTADYLIDNHEATIIFVPMQYGVTDDRITASETMGLMKNKKNVFLLSQECSDMELKAIIGQMDLVIGFRYHFITFAISSGVPAIGLYSDLYYSTKICGILSLAGFENNAFRLQDIQFANFIQLINKNLNEKDEVSKKLLKKIPYLKRKGLLSFEYATQLLKS